MRLYPADGVNNDRYEQSVRVFVRGVGIADFKRAYRVAKRHLLWAAFIFN